MDENEDRVRIKNQKMEKYRKLDRRLKKEIKTYFMAFLIILLLLLILPIGTFMIYCVSVRSGKAVIDTYETPEGHTLTVTQLGRQEHLGNTFLFLIEVDGEKYLRFPLTASYTEERLYPSENVSCASNSFGEVVLQMDSGSEPCEFRFSSDFQVIHFIRSESYTLLKDGVEVLEYNKRISFERMYSAFSLCRCHTDRPAIFKTIR